MSLNGKGLAAVGVGALFVWSGVKGFSVLGSIRDIITGNPPATIDPALQLTDSTGTSFVTQSSVTGLAGLAETGAGHAYKYGGAPGKNAENPWDCSSFVNYMVGVRMGRAIPGYRAGTYDGSVHGPATTQWGVWPGLGHGDRASVQAGDIIVWVGHMGIAIDNTHMISALNPKEGTKVTPIDGYGNGPLLAYGRLNG